MDSEENIAKELPSDFYTSNNITELLSDDVLDELGASLKDQVTTDIESRSQWLKRNDEYMELVTQVIDKKTFPWDGAANIKFPLIATAAVQFHARAFPALLGNPKPVHAKVIGRDKDGAKASRAGRVSTYMSYQVLHDMEEWVDDMDRLLMLVSIIGSLYKKTYRSIAKKENVSEMIHPRDLIINYDAPDIQSARKTHRLWKYPNDIVELQNRGIYRELDEETQTQPTKPQSEVRDKIHGIINPGKTDTFALQELFEVHCLLDLDGDGYKEPYVATIRETDGKVYKLVANYSEALIEREQDKIVAIKPKDYFTHYYFLPDPESKTHGVGFGTMVGPINEAVNTILNQLTDAGTLSALQGGFLSRGVRIKGGALRFTPGEWKTINATGDDLRKGIYPLPIKEPSNVLFQLLGLLIDAGKDLSSVQDLMVGRNPGQNQPYATSQAVLEQGMKVFNGIYKRLYRSMTKEFKKIYKLNKEYINIRHYATVLDSDGRDLQEATEKFGSGNVIKYLQKDFNTTDLDIIPTAEPDMVIEMQKVARANSLLEKLAAGIPLNLQVVARRVLEAEAHENIEELLEVPTPQPPPEMILKEKELQLKDKELQHTIQLEEHNSQLAALKTEAEVLNLNVDTELKLAEGKNASREGIHAQYIADQKRIKDEFDSITKRMKVISDDRKNKRAGEQTSGTSK